jgi:tripartite ATP-independent transporter DctM subunit
MSIELVTILLFAIFISLLIAGLPLAFTMGATACIITLILFSPTVVMMGTMRIYNLMLDYAMAAVPLFIFMAAILEKAGVAEQLFQAVYVWSGPLRGGIAIATIIACVLMAAMVGIVGAEIVTLGMIALPAMLERGYHKTIAMGSITAGGGIATLIPPSIVFIVYAMTAGCSVGKLFIAGVIPGFLLAAFFIAYIVYRTIRDPNVAPAATEEERNIPLKEKLRLLKGLIMPAVLGIAVLGSIYTGVATPTEAAGVGCLGAVVAAVLNRKLNFSNLKHACYETLKISCMLYWLFFGAQMIIGVYTLAGGDEFVRSSLTSLPFGRWGILIVMQLIFIFLGMFLDWIGILLLTMPLFLPVVEELGFDIIWFGVVYCMNMHISYLSPPFGPSCFYLSSVAPAGISVTDIYKANFPFLILTIFALIVVIVFPALSLWLPSMMAVR